MPSDGQVDLVVFSALWKEALSDTWDVAKVRRITRETWGRVIVSKILSYTVTALFGIPPIDVNGSPRIFHRNELRRLNLRSKDSFIDTEFAVKAHRMGWKIKEIPMRTFPRSGGVSTRSWRTYWEFIRNLYQFRFNL